MLADGIVSQNIVGYMGNETTAVKSPMFGFTFTSVANTNVIKLGTIKAEGMDVYKDSIQVINPETLVTTAQYSYYSDAQAYEDAVDEAEEPEEIPGLYEEYKKLVGWWQFGKFDKGDSYRRDNVDVVVGSGFLGLSPKSHNITFQCSGEAPTKSTSYAPGAVKQPIVANYLPADCCLKDITVDGMDVYKDSIQVINPTNLTTTAQYSYYSDAQAYEDAVDEAEDPSEIPGLYEEYQKLIGWWQFGKFDKGDSYRRDNVPVKAAAAFLGLSPKKNSLTFNFKSCLDVTKPAAE